MSETENEKWATILPKAVEMRLQAGEGRKEERKEGRKGREKSGIDLGHCPKSGQKTFASATLALSPSKELDALSCTFYMYRYRTEHSMNESKAGFGWREAVKQLLA